MPHEDSLLKKIQLMTEYDLTICVLIPLLKTFGYGRVEYFGGVDEEGKDIVCWRDSEIGDVELTVIQVKRYKPTRRANDEKSMHTIMHQLSQAIEKPVSFIDGCMYLPEILYFATPFSVNTKVLQSRFEAYHSLRARRVRILDGPLIIKLLKERLPALFGSLTGASNQIADAVSPHLTNEILMRALEFPVHRRVETFYTDIDFSLLRPGARLFFSSDLSPSIHSHPLEREEWLRLSKLTILSKEALGCGFIQDLGMLNESFRRHEDAHSVWQAEHSRLADLYFGLAKARDMMEENIKSKGLSRGVITNLILLDEYFSAGLHRLAAERLGWKMFDEPPVEEEVINLAHIVIAEVRSGHVTGDAHEAEHGGRALAISYGSLLKRYIEATSSYNDSNDKKPEFNIVVRIDGTDLVKALLRWRERIDREVEELNARAPSVSDISRFLIGCNKFFEIAQRILSEPKIARSVGLGEGIKPTFEARLGVSVHSVLDTRMNVALLGAAGAGKTTSLQMYTHKVRTSSDRLAIFVPLATLGRIWKDHRSNDIAPPLEDGICQYLRHLGVLISSENLLHELTRSGGILLLDGVDEVSQSLPWFVGSVQRFVDRNTNVQVVVSARRTGRYLDALPFSNIALLPFTREQRDKFIQRWFGEEDDPRVRGILRHLEAVPDVAEIIKNPLLATILCVLAENNVPLPTTEVRLYDERLKLLFGNYDLLKQVSRVRTHSTHLHMAARRIAFRLHSKEQRDRDRETIYRWVEQDLARTLSKDECRLAVDELIDPCGVLVSSNDETRLGFDHLRYQEHLAAQEIASNRGIDIVPLMRQNWWVGTFVLYAQMNQDVETIIYRLAQADGVSGVLETLMAMIRTLPENRRARLENVVRLGEGLDQLIG
jgi:hypothetical protein